MTSWSSFQICFCTALLKKCSCWCWNAGRCLFQKPSIISQHFVRDKILINWFSRFHLVPSQTTPKPELLQFLCGFCRGSLSGGYFLAKGREGGSGNVSDTLQKAPGCHGEFSYFKGQLYFNTSLWKSFFGPGWKKLKYGKLLILKLLTLRSLYGIFKLSFQTRRQKLQLHKKEKVRYAYTIIILRTRTLHILELFTINSLDKETWKAIHCNLVKVFVLQLWKTLITFDSQHFHRHI